MTRTWNNRRWFVVGCLVGTVAQVAHLWPLGFDVTATLRVGADSPALVVIAEELGRVPVTEGQGHDGQYYYLIGRDPLGLRGYPDLADDGGYRFRRPLTGWLAGGWGAFPPIVLVWGLTVLQIVGMGLAASGMGALARRLGRPSGVVVGVLCNLGLWLAVQLVTPDALALGLALWGVVAVLDARWGWAALALVGAALAKDSYLLFALSLAGWLWFAGRRRPAAGVLLAPTAALGAWAVWLTVVTGNGFSTKENFGWPLVGLIEALGRWASSSVGEVVFAIGAVAAVAVGLLGLATTRDALLKWLLAPWLAMAVAASVTIWGDGNNALRVMVPLWALGVSALASRVPLPDQMSSRKNLPV